MRDEAREAAATASREAAGIDARIDALRLSLADGGGSDALQNAQLSALGVVSDSLRIEPGFESAIESALHWAADADALAVADVASAVAALAHLRESRAGRAYMVIADTPRTTEASLVPLPEGRDAQPMWSGRPTITPHPRSSVW